MSNTPPPVTPTDDTKASFTFTAGGLEIEGQLPIIDLAWIAAELRRCMAAPELSPKKPA